MCAGITQRLPVSKFLGLGLHGFAGCCDVEVHAIGDLLPADHVCSLGKILKAWTYKLMHDILYTDMEKTGYVWEKIKDIYRARALAHTFGDTKQMMNGEEINFYDIVRNIRRPAALLPAWSFAEPS